MNDQDPNPITPLDPAQTETQEQQTAREEYVRRVLVAGDIFADVLAGGPQDMTISTRAGLAALHGNFFGKLLSAFLNDFQKDHGADAAAGDMERAQILEKIINDARVLNQPNE